MASPLGFTIMPKPAHQSWNVRPPLAFPVDYIHGFLGQFIRWWFRMTARLRIDYQGPVPRGGYVLACNHRSFLDPLALGCTLRRRIHYFARASLWKIPPIRWVLDLFGGIPVDRAKPQTTTIAAAVGVLRAGRPLLVFPEGTRTRTGRMGRFRDGPSLIARRAQVPVIPVYLKDTEGSWPRGAPLPIPGRGKVHIVFGPWMWPDQSLSVRERDAELTTRIELWLQAQEQRLYTLRPPQ
ncbi:MAG: 1-acyl-sn-glycerol-3-phosphate acyltransferase [Planctomycetota bacterium]|nr:MAG: 1-acyl-sn-glycerol-3-phosphate acyltransferase [Planctomycetota bacterium]